MSKHKYEKVSYEIYPIRSLGAFLGIIASVIGIGTATYLLDGFWQAISIMVLVIMVLLFFVIKLFLRLRTIKSSYNEIVDEINQADDNRATLASIVEEKNKDLNDLNIKLSTTTAVMNFFVSIVYSGTELPDRKMVENVLEIEEKGAKINEGQE